MTAATDLAAATGGTIAVRSATGDPITTRVRLATGFWARFRGLMGSAPLTADEGLFLPVNSIHMLFMRYPIDALFVSDVDAQGQRRVVAIHADLPPWRGLVMPVRGAAGVLEVCAGTTSRSGIAVGDTLHFVAPQRELPAGDRSD